MAKNMKFHAIAISIISTVIIILYMVMGPKEAEKGPLKPTDRYARVSSATWGLECNPMIEEVIRARANIPLEKDAEGKVIQGEPLRKVNVDNVLPIVKAACENQVYCELPANDDIFKVNLLPGCYRRLNVNYRCSEMERLNTVTIDQGQWLKIDCSAPANAPAPAAHS